MTHTLRIDLLTTICAIMAATIFTGTTGCTSAAKAGRTDGTGSDGNAASDTVTTMAGLRYIDVKQGDGAVVIAGMKVRIDYAGYLTNGDLFDTSIESIARAKNFNRGGIPFTPLEFVVGAGKVIRGWDEGLTTNMRVGGKRRLIIPPNLGYGAYGSGPIPPNATLIFDVEVVSAQ